MSGKRAKKIADKNWILTAYDEKAADGKSPVATDEGLAGSSTASSRGKGSESSSSDQTNEEKNEEKGKSSTSQSGNKKKKKGKIYDIAKFAPQRYDFQRPNMNGVYHDPAGYAVASDSRMLMWDKRQYDKAHSGEIIATRDYKADNVKKGDSIRGEYPTWRSVIPVVGVRGRVAVKVDYKRYNLLRSLRGAGAHAPACIPADLRPADEL